MRFCSILSLLLSLPLTPSLSHTHTHARARARARSLTHTHTCARSHTHTHVRAHTQMHGGFDLDSLRTSQSSEVKQTRPSFLHITQRCHPSVLCRPCTLSPGCSLPLPFCSPHYPLLSLQGNVDLYPSSTVHPDGYAHGCCTTLPALSTLRYLDIAV